MSSTLAAGLARPDCSHSTFTTHKGPRRCQNAVRVFKWGPTLFIVCSEMDGRWSVCTPLIFTKEQWALVHRKQIDKRWTGRGEEGEKQQIKSNAYCSVISLPSLLPVWIMCFTPAFFHESLSFPLYLPLSLPLSRIKVLDAVYINLSIFLRSWRSDCEMMLFDNVLTNVEKNRVGWGNHRGQGGNGSRVTLQLSISFLPLLSLLLFGSHRHTFTHAATYLRRKNTNLFFYHHKHHCM